MNEDDVLFSLSMHSSKTIEVCSTFCGGPGSIPDGDQCSAVTVPRGLHVKGAVSIFGYTAFLNISADYDHIRANVTLEPLKLAGGLIQVTATKEDVTMRALRHADIPLLDYVWELSRGELSAPALEPNALFASLVSLLLEGCS